MYRTRQVRIRKKNPLRDYCAALCLGSTVLYNRANFLIRQYATACRDLEEGKPLTGGPDMSRKAAGLVTGSWTIS